MAREQWTQFGNASMVAGMALLAATLVLQAAVAWPDAGKAAAKGTSKAARKGKAATGGGTAASADSIQTDIQADGTAGGAGAAAPAGRLAALDARLQAWQVTAPLRANSRLRVPTLRAWLAALAAVHAAGVFSFFYLLSEGTNVCYLVAAACAGLALAAGRAARASGGSVRGVVAAGVMSLRFNALMALLGVAHHTGQVRRLCRVGPRLGLQPASLQQLTHESPTWPDLLRPPYPPNPLCRASGRA